MLQLNNNTPFATKMALFPNEKGIDTLYLVVKASFNIGKDWTLCDEQVKPLDADKYYGEPNESSIKYPSDMHIGKVATDIIVLGKACAKNRQAVTELDVGISIGKLSKNIKVFGNRQWNNGLISQPESFETMSMIYEKAFGGTDSSDPDKFEIFSQNPLGLGFSKHKSVNQMNGEFLPNLEDPNNLIKQLKDQPDPVCFAPIAASWQPRVQCAGTYDDDWKENRAPYLPLDFKKQFCNTAHKDLTYPGFLQGGEQVEISNMHPAGRLRFQLPVIKLSSKIHIGDKPHQAGFNLETLLIEPNLLQLSMTWRAAFQCNKKSLKIDNIDINLTR